MLDRWVGGQEGLLGNLHLQMVEVPTRKSMNRMDSGRESGRRESQRSRAITEVFLFSIDGSFNKISIHTSNKRQTNGKNTIPMTDMSDS